MKLDSETYYGVYKMRLRGKTFKAIGNHFHFTKQRAQKIFKDFAKIKTKTVSGKKVQKDLDICEYCVKRIIDKEERIECEEGEIKIAYHSKCWKKVVFN